MSATNFARPLLSALAVPGLDETGALNAEAGSKISAVQGGDPVVTLILSGVAARLGPDGSLSRGLASGDEAINFDAVLGRHEEETAIWLTAGRFLTVAARMLSQKIDRDTLFEAALTDLRYRHAALQTELSRHATMKVNQRLAALLLDVHKRSGHDVLALRQTELSQLMAVRRASISTACTELCAAGAVRLRRGAIQIIDADALRRMPSDAYSTVTDLARLRG